MTENEKKVRPTEPDTKRDGAGTETDEPRNDDRDAERKSGRRHFAK